MSIARDGQAAGPLVMDAAVASGAHAPNEYMVIEPRAGSCIAGLAAVEKFYVDFLYAFGREAIPHR